MKESYLYQKLNNNIVRCETCQHKCAIKDRQRGFCGVKENRRGKLIALNYGRAIAAHIDPIEKKPLYNFMPGSLTYSIATVGCNFRCRHCQNYEISIQGATKPSIRRPGREQEIAGQEIIPEEVVQNAISYRCPSISYTYTEPTIFLEYALDTMKLAAEKNLKNVWVSNGYMSAQTLKLIVPYLAAINVDLKSFSEKFYREVCGAKLAPVLENLIKIKKAAIHLEVTTLIIPGYNDSSDELKQIAEFIKNKLSTDTPWHVTVFYPTYKMLDIPATPKEKILEAKKIGQTAGLKFVYTGNI